MRYLRAVLGWTILASVCGIAWMYSVPSARTQTVVNGSDSNWHDNIAAAITAIGQQDIRIGTLETNTAGLNATNTSQQATNATFATTYAKLSARVDALEAKVGTTPPTNPPSTTLAIGAKVIIGAGAGPVRNCTTDGSLGAQLVPAPAQGTIGTITAGPTTMGSNTFWKVQLASAIGCLGADVLTVAP